VTKSLARAKVYKVFVRIAYRLRIRHFPDSARLAAMLPRQVSAVAAAPYSILEPHPGGPPRAA
jgi:hypothetical protein